MKRNGFSIIELVVVIGLFSLLFASVVSLLSRSQQRLSAIEDEVICSTQAGIILSTLRRDLERCMAFGDAADSLSMARGAIRFADDVLSFSVLDGKDKSDITYSFNPQTRTIEYIADGKTILLGKDLVRSFFACHQILCTDNVVRSLPFDPDQVGMEPPMEDPLPGAGRSWVKISLTVGRKSPSTQKVIEQAYVFRFFPVRLNRQLQSLWAPGRRD